MRQSSWCSARLLTGLIVAGALAAGSTVRAADPPDFTGVWTNYSPPAGQGRAGGAAGAGRGAAPGGRGAAPGTARGGAGGRGAAALPMTEVGRQKVAAYRALVSPTSETPGGYCLGTGMPGSMLGSGGYPMEIIQRPEQITVIYEAHAEIRRIYIGDRNMKPEDRIPGRNGYSSGRWDGDTLVVETTQLVEQVDQQYAHSDQATIVERYRMTTENGRKVLTAEMTMTDPVFYTEPVKAEKRWSEVPNGHLLPYECAEETWNKRLEELEQKVKPAPAR